MEPLNANIDLVGTLDAVVIRRDGSRRNLGQLSGPQNYKLIGRPVQWWRKLWNSLRANGIIPASMGFAAFMATYGVIESMEPMRQLFSD